MAIKINHAALAALSLLSFSFFAMSSADADGSLKDEPQQSTVVWTGIDKANGAFAAPSGFITALNGDNSVSGFLVRGDLLYVHTPDGQIWQGNPLIGYQAVGSWLTAAGYVGADFHKLPDAVGTRAQGYETGFKVAASLETDEEKDIVANIHGEYSTAFDTYWVRARGGYNFKTFIAGPEGILVGNESFRAEKSGAFAAIPLKDILGRDADLIVAGGYQWVKGFDNQSSASAGTAPASPVGQTGGYFSVAVSFVF